MSYDFMEDALDSLDKSGDFYVLIYGRSGDKKTKVTSNLQTEEDFDHTLDSLVYHKQVILKKKRGY